MANELDELTGPTNSEGRDVNVIEKQLKVEIGVGTKLFEFAIWAVGVLLTTGIAFGAGLEPLISLLIIPAGLIPGLIFQYMKTNALAYLRKLQQKIQADASQIDNYLEQRVIILKNLVSLLEKSIELDKDVMKSVAALRSGASPNPDISRNQESAAIDAVASQINIAVEAYPDLRAQENIASAIRQNANLQKEVTAARALYNDTVARWNQDIFSWPTRQIVSAKSGFTTRIPFIASAETKAAARQNFFE
jgi:LemA protein